MKFDFSQGNILIFAGAGISQESGLSTFRDNGGLWDKFDVMEICNFQKFLAHTMDMTEGRQDIFDFYNMRKREIQKAQPNFAHYKIAEWQQTFGDRVKIVTSNIDDLFEKAGCTNVVHIHGETEHMKCAVCDHRWHIGEEEFDADELCPNCGSEFTKPNVVFFGEGAPEYATMADVFDPKRRTAQDHLFYIGSSMQVVGPAMVFGAPHRNWSLGTKVLIDANANDLFKGFPYFDRVDQNTAVASFRKITVV
jgi:NAD-dependent deacetylase